MSKRTFDRKIEELEALRSAVDQASTRAQLGKALRDRNNYLVAKGAALAADLKLEDLIPELLAAFERFFTDPVKTDPHCLAKHAIAKALKALGYRDAQPFLRGIVHVQLEPTWGGRADTAADLRGTCALALTDCQLDDIEILTYLADGLADPEKSVRINSAIAINQLNRPEGAVPLRLKLLSGDSDSDVVGQCFSSLLSLAPPGAVTFVRRFLQSEDESIQLEAASALAQSRDPEAIEVITEFWEQPLLSLELRRLVLINLGASPVSAAAEFLLSVVGGESAGLAATAIAALATSRFQAEVHARVAALVERSDTAELRRIFAQKWPAQSSRP
jgi:HEAT repeat protein